MTIAKRLYDLRIKAKLRSKKAAAEAYGIGYETYKKIEAENLSDPRNLTIGKAHDIADYHSVRVAWLLFGEGSPSGPRTIRLQGKIGAGQAMMIYDNLEDGDAISAEIAADAIAFQVEGDSMMPLAHDRDIVFVGPDRRDIETLIGQECAVLLEDGRRFFKVIENSGQKGRYDLVSYNAERIRAVEIHSAGPFIGLRRTFRATKRKRQLS